MNKKADLPIVKVIDGDIEFALKVLRQKVLNGRLLSTLKGRADYPFRPHRLKAKRQKALRKHELKKRKSIR